jgi:ubiquinone/menaquinone biosynthesis C-methylase UbiE
VTPHEQVQAQYGKQAGYYSVSVSHATSDTLQLMLELAQPKGSERVLDVATGTGFCAMAFAPHVKEVVAYDLTPQMLAEAERLATERGIGNMRFEQGPAEAMPFDDGSFEIVTARTGTHHFDSVPKFMAESMRVLTPGGQLLIADTSSPDDAEADAWEAEIEILRDPSHVRDYNMAEWKAFVHDAGFELIEARQWNWTELTFRDWVLRSGTPPAAVEKLRELFANAPASAVEAFQIQRQGADDFVWTWPVVLLAARKPR